MPPAFGRRRRGLGGAAGAERRTLAPARARWEQADGAAAVLMHKAKAQLSDGRPPSAAHCNDAHHLALALAACATALRAPAPRASLRSSTAYDVVVVGGGMSGLSTALELRRRGRSVCVLSRDLAQAATLAAGGMLAPQAERLPGGPLLDLCVRSREAWPAWLATLDDPPPLHAVGGFVSPCLDVNDPVGTWKPVEAAGPAEWLEGAALRAMEPSLGPKALGGWWYPLETWVDPVRAHAALLRTCEREGVDVRTGVDVEGLDLERSGTCGGVRLAGGDVLTGDEYCVAAGAWLRNLLPVPVDAQKGQMVALKAPTAAIAEKAPRRVVYGADCYATALCPGLGDFEVDEAWSGLRPTTVDGAPVLGRTRWTNLCRWDRFFAPVSPSSARFLPNHAPAASPADLDAAGYDAIKGNSAAAGGDARAANLDAVFGAAGPPPASPADLDRAGYDAIKGAAPAAGDDARSANRAALLGGDGPRRSPRGCRASSAVPRGARGGSGGAGREGPGRPRRGRLRGRRGPARGRDGRRARRTSRRSSAAPVAGDAPAAPSRPPDNGFPYADPAEDVATLVVAMREVLPDGSLGADVSRAALPGDLAGPVTKADGISSLMPLPDAPPLPPDAAADALYAKIAAAKRAR
ncbi:MAP kinase [Aureococcus anophagefferens]|nr:MAP kinase [Aureococcus anophagefferens]